MVKLAPSILAADFGRLAEEAALMARLGAEYLHFDVMDGHFVPNLTMGADIVKALRKRSGLVFDVHLMIADPEKYLRRFIDAGSDIITFHIETGADHAALIGDIKAAGRKAGVSLNPDIPVEKLLPVLASADLVLVMSVFAGFGGQKFIEDSLRKIKWLKDKREELGLSYEIEVDGGINAGTAASVIAAGADTLVAGSGIFGPPGPEGNIKTLREIISRAKI